MRTKSPTPLSRTSATRRRCGGPDFLRTCRALIMLSESPLFSPRVAISAVLEAWAASRSAGSIAEREANLPFFALLRTLFIGRLGDCIVGIMFPLSSVSTPGMLPMSGFPLQRIVGLWFISPMPDSSTEDVTPRSLVMSTFWLRSYSFWLNFFRSDSANNSIALDVSPAYFGRGPPESGCVCARAVS